MEIKMDRKEWRKRFKYRMDLSSRITHLTKGGDIIRSRTYSAFMPLITVAVIYLVMVMFFTYLVGRLERRLRNDER